MLCGHSHDGIGNLLHLHAVWVLQLEILVDQLQHRLVVGRAALLQHLSKHGQDLVGGGEKWTMMSNRTSLVVRMLSLRMYVGPNPVHSNHGQDLVENGPRNLTLKSGLGFLKSGHFPKSQTMPTTEVFDFIFLYTLSITLRILAVMYAHEYYIVLEVTEQVYLDCQRGVGIIDVTTDSRQPEIATVAELLGGVHLEHLAHVAHLRLALLTLQVHGCTGLQEDTCM